MEAYVNDKRIIYQGQNKNDLTVASADDPWGRSFLAESPGRTLAYSARPLPSGAWLDPVTGAGMISGAALAATVPAAAGSADAVEVVPPVLLVPGAHQKKNCLAAALALLDLGLPVPLVRESLGNFPGIEHRLEFFREIGGIRFYNDTAATIPEAAAAAVEAFAGNSLVLVTGGTDKDLDFSPLLHAVKAAGFAMQTGTAMQAGTFLDIILLAGTGSDKLGPLLKGAGLSFHGPFDNIDTAAETALELAQGGRRGGGLSPTVVLSPGCASFGMFTNEFDRGRQWKEAVRRL
jgi:UDP-N-acetylmuramoylalanine--D-glutamate ligase